MQNSSSVLKVGILGGGQLGRMLLQVAANYPVETWIMENDTECPSAHLCHHFVKGDIKNYSEVYNFGKGLDALTIEIENVNVEALEQLEQEGIKVFPKPSVLKIIRDKIQQKEYYRLHQIPTSNFVITQNLEELKQQQEFLPAVHKLAIGGYDGRGVKMIATKAELETGFDQPAVLEKMISIQKEIAVLVAINEKKETALYPPVEMLFDPVLNLLNYQLCPAELTTPILYKVEAVALAVAKNFNSPGLFAVEMFLDKTGNVFVN
ncbi:MAG: ATP-grasp domain-containing protein, partial [Bacteroidetes bacterium]|nr:ATP-grasp domain-containing protein [Bacteroidota bacterium]